MSATYRVAEQFVSINGEGTRAGELAVFVRLCGCNLQCSYCDTQWANQPDVSYQLQTTEEIVQAILETGVRNVTLTGGEPLLTPNVAELISAITATSFAAAISPLSTGGAIIMSSYSAARETTTEEMNKMFYTLFLLSVGNVVVNVLMAAIGVFSLGGLF